jgi:phosphatidylserine/phosphatidylglycerophosphate/cardiolipin synthase-like enzyme
MIKLLVQPGDGVEPLVRAIQDAKSTLDILIFRFDRAEIESALVKAVSRGVAVRALIAYTNRGGEKGLRALEMRLLAAGVTVSRTDDDLIRYHGKMMVADERVLYLLAFNFTHLDMERSRSFGLITDEKKTVAEAMRLFDADSKRVPYEPEMDEFVVSPLNSRKVLAEFLKGAKKDLLIYDPAVTDPAMARILSERAKAEVTVRVLGKLSKRANGVECHPLYMRLHTRTIVRDGEAVFMGSQSLRAEELDARREIGLILEDDRIAKKVTEVFEEDWSESEKLKASGKEECESPPARKVAKKVAKTVTKTLPPVGPVLEVVVREMAGSETGVSVDTEALEASVKDAVKTAIQEAVATAVEQASGK